MAKLSRGKYAQAISDRSGMAFPYNEMVTEWDGSFVHNSEFESKQPQIQPTRFTGDPQGLSNARPARVEPPTADLLTPNPFKLPAATGVIDVIHSNSGIQVGDQVRLTATNSIATTNLAGTEPSTMSVKDIELSTTLAADITASATTLTLTDNIQTASVGFLIIEKVNPTTGLFENEIVKYTSRTSLGSFTYSGLTRGTNVSFRGITPVNTTASAHLAGAKVFGSRQVSSLNSTNGYLLTSTSVSGTETERSGGENCTSGPLNDKG